MTSLTSTRHSEQAHEIRFDVLNSDPLSSGKTTCSKQWAVAEEVASWTTCEDDSFGFRLTAPADVQNFTLEVKNTFRDPR